MENKPERTPDISAELRDLSESAKHCKLLPCTIYGKPVDLYFAELADRVDAAHTKAVDNLRMALVKAHTMLKVCDWPEGTDMDGVATLMREIEATIDATEGEVSK